MEISAWVTEQTLHCPWKRLASMLFSQKTLPDTFHTVLRRCGHHGSSNSLKAHVTLDVLLATYARSREQITSALSGFSPPVHLYEIGCLWAGSCWKEFKTNLYIYKGPLPLRCYCGREHTPLIGVSASDTFLTSNATGFDLCVYHDILEWRFDSLRDGDQSDFTPVGVSPLLSPSLASGSSSLRSTYKAWKAGTSKGDVGGYFILWLHLGVFCCSTWVVRSLVLSFLFELTALSLSENFLMASGPSETEGTWLIRGDWRFTWVDERQVSTKVPGPYALRTVHDGVSEAKDHELSVLGDVFAATPMVLPVRGRLDVIKRLLKSDLYIGRGSRQRSLVKSRYCNTFKVSQYGRVGAIAGFRDALISDRKLHSSLWTAALLRRAMGMS